MLFALKPLGLGTAFVESLTSYTGRLCAEHRQRPSNFIAELIREPYRAATGCNFAPSTQITQAINGAVTGTPVLVAYLKSLTWVDAIEHTAIATRAPGIYLARSARVNRAWCPACLDADEKPYDRLLWSLAAYETCLVHGRALVDRCGTCQKTHRPMWEKAGANACPHCDAALSASSSAERAASARERILGDLIARLERDEPITREQVHAGVAAFVRASGGKIYVAAAKIKRSHGSIANILRLRSPMGLENLLLTIEASGETLDAFLAHPQEPWTVRRGHRRGGGGKLTVSVPKVERALRRALAGGDDDLPTMTDFAAANGISQEMLRKHLPALCDQLVERGFARRRQRSVEHEQRVIAELKAVMREIFQETGRVTSYAVQQRFPNPRQLAAPAIAQALRAYKAELLAEKEEAA